MNLFRKSAVGQPGAPPSMGSSGSAMPWLDRKDWAAGRIRSDLTNPIGIVIVLSICGGVAAALFGSFAIDAYRDTSVWLAIPIALPGVVLGTVFGLIAIYILCQQFRYGRSLLELSAVPIWTGGTLRGIVHIPRRLPDRGEFQLKLRCIKRITAGRKPNDQTLWEQKFTAPGQYGDVNGAETTIRISIDVPADAIPSTPPKQRTSEPIRWELSIRHNRFFLNYDAMFRVPVFSSGSSMQAHTFESSEVRR